jgi:peptidoglycan/LPS O-acetylase OafA/YrhL
MSCSVGDDTPGTVWGSGRQSRHSLSLPGDLTGWPAGQWRWRTWVIRAVVLTWAIAAVTVYQTPPLLEWSLLAGPSAVVVLLVLAGALATAGPRRRARVAARAEIKAEYQVGLDRSAE